jgi:mannose-6-phosphate isomerase-like protein (cupin superfamily)
MTHPTSRLARAGVFCLLALTTVAMAADRSPQANTNFVIRTDREVTHVEPTPHDGTGTSTAYRYFDDVQGARVIFRKRALHRDASIGMHALSHDEVYYVISGHGELIVDDTKNEIGPDSAVFMRQGARVGIRQRGEQDLVLIISYPAAE